MTNSKKTVDAIISKHLSGGPDMLLAMHGLFRRKNSISYKRDVVDGTQELVYDYSRNPRYRTDSCAHLLPRFVFTCPLVNCFVVKYINKESVYYTATKDMPFINMQISNCLPISAREQMNNLHLIPDDEINNAKCFEVITSILKSYILKFIDKYSSIDGILNGYSLGETGLQNDLRFYVNIAICFLINKNYHQAKQVLEKHFRHPSANMHTSHLYSYINNLILG